MSTSGYVQSEILFAPEVGTGIVAAINPTLTVLCGPFDVRVYAAVAGTLENPDVLQVIKATAQSSWDGLTKWTDVRQFFDLDDIQPGEVRPFFLETTALRYLRFTGVAVGAGIVNCPMNVLRCYSNTGVRGPAQRG